MSKLFFRKKAERDKTFLENIDDVVTLYHHSFYREAESMRNKLAQVEEMLKRKKKKQ